MLFLSLTTKTFIKIIFHDYFHLSLISLPSLVYLSLCLFLDLCQFICFSVQCVSSVPSHYCLHGVIRLHLLFARVSSVFFVAFFVTCHLLHF